MPDHDKVVRVVGAWIGKAEEDLKAAASLLELAGECPAGACAPAARLVRPWRMLRRAAAPASA